MRTTETFLLVALAVMTLSCDSVPGVSSLLSGGDADLVPLPAAGFCNGSNLVVTLRNQGAGDADASTTRVVFSRGGSVDIAAPSIESGRIATLSPVGIPGECFAPDCALQVIADGNDDVSESDENNNTFDVTCPAPS